MWTRDEIVEDLKKLAASGEKPDIFQLKMKYGYNLNSELFPLLENIRITVPELTGFIGEIFKRVKDLRDLQYIFGRIA